MAAFRNYVCHQQEMQMLGSSFSSKSTVWTAVMQKLGVFSVSDTRFRTLRLALENHETLRWLLWVIAIKDWEYAVYPIKNYRGLSPNYRGKRWVYVHFIRGAANPPIIYLRAHLRFTPRSLQVCLFAHFNKWSTYD